jgi:hypothetical protein
LQYRPECGDACIHVHHPFNSQSFPRSIWPATHRAWSIWTFTGIVKSGPFEVSDFAIRWNELPAAEERPGQVRSSKR